LRAALGGQIVRTGTVHDSPVSSRLACTHRRPRTAQQRPGRIVAHAGAHVDQRHAHARRLVTFVAMTLMMPVKACISRS
jgi:hypothetical protein